MVWTFQLLFRLCQILAVFSVYELITSNGRLLVVEIPGDKKEKSKGKTAPAKSLAYT